MPTWLVELASMSLSIAGLCALAIVADLSLRGAQHMWIMNVVWPITGLWAGPVGLWAYLRWGRAASEPALQRAKSRGQAPPSRRQSFAVLTGKAATHCGGGCTLGDLIAEWLIVWIPITVFGKRIFGAWIYDFTLAYLFGIVFQYFTIKPMRGESTGRAIWSAIKADTLSLIAWQVGMYGWMAIATFAIFGRELPKTSPVFWFMMQLAMFCGFATAYPVNWLLLRHGVKEKM